MPNLGSRLTGVPIDTRGGVTGEALVMQDGKFSPGSLSVDVGFSGASVYLGADQTITTGTNNFQPIEWDTERFDTEDYHDNTTNKTRFTIPETGRYEIKGTARWDGGQGSTAQSSIGIRKNGGSVSALFAVSPGSTTEWVTLQTSDIMDLVAGDYLEFVVEQRSGSNKTLQGSSDSSYASIHRLGTTGGQSNLLGEVVLTADTAFMEIADIPDTYKDLRLEFQLRSDQAGEFEHVEIQVGNGSVDTATNYRSYRIYDGTTGGQNHYDGVNEWLMDGAVPGDNADSGLFGYTTMVISGYKEVAEWRHFTASTNHIRTPSNYFAMDFYGVWENTADAIDVVRLTPQLGSNWKAGSTFRIYGEPVLGGGEGLVKGDFLPGDLYLGGEIFENQPPTSRTPLYAVGGDPPGGSESGFSQIWQAETIGEYDDYFITDTSADWTEIAPDTGTLDWSYNHEPRFALYRGLHGNVSASISANDIGAAVKPVTGISTAADYIQTAWSISRAFVSGGTRDHGGLLLTDGTTTSANIVGIGAAQDNNASSRIHTLTGTLGAIVSTFRQFRSGQGAVGMPVHYRLTYTASNEFTVAWSLDGVTFTTILAISTTMTPTHAGFYLTNDGNDNQQGLFHYFHSNVTS